MEESEKMVELKKAYAEIIMNSAKDAAERVMESEKKALRFHHDLCNTKDQALHLLVRLKHMIHAKTIEAEITSSTQQNKIDELEAQLQEAEGVIVDLRAELSLLHDKLKKAKNGQVGPLNGKVIGDNELSHQNGTSPIELSPPNLGLQAVTTSDVNNEQLDHRNFNNKCCNAIEHTEQLSVSHFENYSSHNADLSSIIMTNKEPELYRNGYAQRIRASEGNLLTGNLSPSREEVNQHSPLKNNLIIKASNGDEGKFAITSPKTKNMEKKKNFSGEEVRKHVKVHSSRRRKTRFGKVKVKRKTCPTPMRRCLPPSIVSRRKTCSVNRTGKSDEISRYLFPIKNGNVDAKNESGDIEEKMQGRNSCPTDEMIIDERKRSRTAQSTNAVSTSITSPLDQHSKFCQPSPVLTHCNTYTFLLHGNVKSNEDQSKIGENEVKLKLLPRLDPGLTLIRGGVDPCSGSTNVTVSVKTLNRSGMVQNAGIKDVVCQEHDANRNLTVPCYEPTTRMAADLPLICSNRKDAKSCGETMVSLPLVHSDLNDYQASKEPNVTPNQSDDRSLKYTFQRKRKKEAFSSPDKTPLFKKSYKEKREEDYQEDTTESQNSSLINESTRESQPLAEVAHQFISLSGKRQQ